MQTVLGDPDTMQAVAAQLTRAQAVVLARSCRAGRAYVSEADARHDVGLPDGFVVEAPMWALERTRARVAAWWPQTVPRNSWRRNTILVMNALAAELVRQQEEERVVRLVFERAAARAGRKLSVFGCHRLEVLDAYAFLQHMESWLETLRATAPTAAVRQFYMNDRCFVHTKASSIVWAMLRTGGLKIRGKKYRLADDAARGVGGAEALWHSAYWAW